jgi:hypothetical protein
MYLTLRRAGVLAAAIIALHASASAQLRTGHAIPGFYGMESSVPPRLGFRYENAMVAYSSDTQKGRDGGATQPGKRISHLSNHSTLTWTSPWLLFGGNWVMSARIPITNSETNPHSTSIVSDGVGLGDILLEPLTLYWEGNRHYFHMKYGFWVNSGEFDYDSSASRGKGFTTHQASMGVTFFPRPKRDWHVSLLGRYEFHSDIEGADLTPGQDLIVDWSVGKHLSERWNVGLVGYGLWQVSAEKGEDGNDDQGYYGAAAAGAEVRYAMPDWGGDLRLRGFWEFNAFNRPEGLMLFAGLNFGF